MKRGKSGGEPIRQGLAESHAYSIIGCKEIEGRKFITVRNPWGQVECTYNRITKLGKIYGKRRYPFLYCDV